MRRIVPQSLQYSRLMSIARATIPEELSTIDAAGPKEKMSFFQAINSAMSCALASDNKVLHFGEDVGFGGVFRCSMGLQEKFGRDRVFNTPLSEQGIAGFAIGLATLGWKPIAEIQFADYIFPAFDQIVNEAAKYRFRSGGDHNCGGVVFRSPCSSVGHGGLYHSQSVEAFFAHCAGLKIVIPSTPVEAKGLLMQCVAEPDPCLFFEPKRLYRAAVEDVPQGAYVLPLGKGRIVRPGTDLTIITYGSQVDVSLRAAQIAKEKHNTDVEVIDLRTIVPWDVEMCVASVKKTGRVIVTHEASVTGGFGAEIVATIAQEAFLHLEAPPLRVCGMDTPVPLHEKLYFPNEWRLIDAIVNTAQF